MMAVPRKQKDFEWSATATTASSNGGAAPMSINGFGFLGLLLARANTIINPKSNNG